MTDHNARQAEALHSAVAAIYFADSSDYLSALWSVVQHLEPELVAGLRNSPKLAFNQSMARLEAATFAAHSADARNGEGVALTDAEIQSAYDAYIDREKNKPGMPGIFPKPAFFAGAKLAQAAPPAAPAQGDERKLFEARGYKSAIEGDFIRDGDGQYANRTIQHRWEAWRERARIARGCQYIDCADDFGCAGCAAPAAPAPKLTPHTADIEQMLDCDEAAPAPAAQADGDEREKFESVFCGLDFTSHTNGEYLNPYVEHMWEGWHRRALQSATPPECTCPSGNGSLRHPCPAHAVAPVAQWEDPRVQRVYEILCADETPQKGEHWEGFAARRIVDAIATPADAASETDKRDAVSLRSAANLAYNALHECKPLKGAEQQVSDAIQALHETLKDRYDDKGDAPRATTASSLSATAMPEVRSVDMARELPLASVHRDDIRAVLEQVDYWILNQQVYCDYESELDESLKRLRAAMSTPADAAIHRERQQGAGDA